MRAAFKTFYNKLHICHRPACPGDPIFFYALSMEKIFSVYIMASKPWGTLYVGVTSDLQTRVHQHREGLFSGFTKQYGVKTLVYFEDHDAADSAIHREKRMKKWTRALKIALIRTANPDWVDLAADWYPAVPTAEEAERWVARTSRAMTNLG